MNKNKNNATPKVIPCSNIIIEALAQYRNLLISEVKDLKKAMNILQEKISEIDEAKGVVELTGGDMNVGG